jgi:hypothetical protein
LKKKFVLPEKLAAEFSQNMLKKGPKRGQTFLNIINNIKSLKLTAEKCISSPDILVIFCSLFRSVYKPVILAIVTRFCRGPNFVASG